jgi:glycosyltransferase involved in cell wall biosynthesis
MRNNKRIIYTSSYDRGLLHLLEMWPQVREQVPDAELHVFYGWQLFKQFYKDNPASMKWMEKMNALMEQDGITDHGRVSQPVLKKEIEKSGIWAYPTHFGEINCISAIKAQAYGAEPVVVNYAALQETVQFGRKVEGDIYDKETKEKFLKELVEALKNPMSDEKRSEMMKWAQEKYSWENVAKSWNEVFLHE